MNSYNLSRNFVDFSFENPTKIKPIHYAIYFFAIEHCNRLGWKKEYGLPTTMTMEAIGVRSYNTYSKALFELVDYGFIKMIEKSKNQYSSNIIALSKYDKALGKALDKAFIKHDTKQSESTQQSIDSINKPITINNKPINNKDILTEFKNSLKPFLDLYGKDMLNDFYNYWTEKGDRARKYRWQKEKSWSLERRLQRWKKNDFGNNTNNLKSENNEQLKQITNEIRKSNPNL